MFEADPSRLYDLEANTSGTKLKFWLHRRGIGLDLSFRRITQDELSSILETDRQESDRRWQLVMKERERKISECREKFGGAGLNSQAIQGSKEIAEIAREQQQSESPIRPSEIQVDRRTDMIGAGVKRWVTSNCLDDEQRIPLLNFENVVLHGGGRRVVIRDGIVATAQSTISISYSAMLGGPGIGFML